MEKPSHMLPWQKEGENVRFGYKEMVIKKLNKNKYRSVPPKKRSY
jgi:succinate dehydrogenase (ubiquinone) flavoprotein subunit